MPAEIRTPFSTAPATPQAGGTWRKKVLPVGSVEYQGRVLKFDKRYLDGLAQAYQAGAYDQVPFQLADAKNAHTNDPERTRGWVTGVDVTDDGLYITASVTPDGNKVLRANPNLGVSARIVEDYARSDGKYYPAAIQHVLGTLDPRITGLGPWEQVELSNVPDMIIDLSAATFAGEDQEGGITMPDLDPGQQNRLAQLLELDPAALSALLDSQQGGAPAPVQDPGGDDLDDDDLAAAISSMTDDEFAQLAEAYEIDGDIAPQPQLVGTATLSNAGYGMTELEFTNSQLAETQRQMSVLQERADRETYENEKRTLAGKYNVPPFITELARPLLEGAGHVVEMSNGQGVDAGLVVRRVLQEFGRVTAGLGLEAPVELGTAMDDPDTSQHAAQEREDTVSRFRNQVGI